MSEILVESVGHGHRPCKKVKQLRSHGLAPFLSTFVAIVCASSTQSAAQSPPIAAAIDAYLQPYVRSNNFSGDVLIRKNGRVVFEKAYGFADREHRIPNTAATKFHVASVSMQFTAAAVLRLADLGSIDLDERIGTFTPGIPGSDKISVRDLLIERSGLPDINSLPAYDDILQHHQTPAALIAKIEGQALLFEPGSKFLHEEHSAYNLLALIVEKKTGLPFAVALERLVFHPVGLTRTGVDDDAVPFTTQSAKGYQPDGTYELQPAAAIHWSAKTGNGSAFTTARDETHWINALFQGKLLSETSRELVVQNSTGIGYGWFKSENKRLGEIAYY